MSTAPARSIAAVSDGYVSKKRYRTKDGTERVTWTCQVVLTDGRGRRIDRKTFGAPTERKVKEKRDAFKAKVQEDARRA
ncbi:MAG: hypothetical protein ACXVAO_06310, partial [Vulcanimicrobiaceae bacterium]